MSAVKCVAIDYGLERTGLAACDEAGVLAYPLTTLRLADYPDRKAFLAALAQRVLAEAPDAVVLGLPLLDDGSESLTTRQVRNVAGRLMRRIDRPFYWMPELLSSVEAAMDLREAGLARKRHKAVLDQQAAVRILASFLALPPARRQPIEAAPSARTAPIPHDGPDGPAPRTPA